MLVIFLRINLSAFKTIIISREVFTPKFEEFFWFKFFCGSELCVTNIKGLFGHPVILVVFFEGFNIRISNDLMCRTGDALDSSSSFVKTSLTNEKIIRFWSAWKFDAEENLSIYENEKFLGHENSIVFHLDNYKETNISLGKQVCTVYDSRNQSQEQIEFMCNYLFKLNESILTVELISDKIYRPRIHLVLQDHSFK